MLLGYFLSDNALVLVIVSKLYLGNFSFLSWIACFFRGIIYLGKIQPKNHLKALSKRSLSWGYLVLLPRFGFRSP